MLDSEFDKIIGDDYSGTGSVPYKEPTLNDIKNYSGEPPVTDIKYYLSKNLPNVLDSQLEFDMWMEATLYLIVGSKNWCDYNMHCDTYRKIMKAKKEGDYVGTTIMRWKNWEKQFQDICVNKLIYFRKKYSQLPYDESLEPLYQLMEFEPLSMEQYQNNREEFFAKYNKKEKIDYTKDEDWQPWSFKGNGYEDENVDEDYDSMQEQEEYNSNISSKVVNGMSNEEMARFVCDSF